jgi:hypothetical protein
VTLPQMAALSVAVQRRARCSSAAVGPPGEHRVRRSEGRGAIPHRPPLRCRVAVLQGLPKCLTSVVLRRDFTGAGGFAVLLALLASEPVAGCRAASSRADSRRCCRCCHAGARRTQRGDLSISKRTRPVYNAWPWAGDACRGGSAAAAGSTALGIDMALLPLLPTDSGRRRCRAQRSAVGRHPSSDQPDRQHRPGPAGDADTVQRRCRCQAWRANGIIGLWR